MYNFPSVKKIFISFHFILYELTPSWSQIPSWCIFSLGGNVSLTSVPTSGFVDFHGEFSQLVSGTHSVIVFIFYSGCAYVNACCEWSFVYLVPILQIACLDITCNCYSVYFSVVVFVFFSVLLLC